MSLIQELKSRIDNHPEPLWQNDISLKRNEFLKVKGSSNLNLYYVLNGSLRVFIEDEFEEHTIRFGYKGSFIAALDSFISEKSSELNIQAIKQCELKVIHKSTFMNFIESSSENLSLWHKVLAQLIFQQIEREVDILTHSPRVRYNRVLERSPQLFQEVPHKYIASYLRMTPETLSRIKKS